VRYSLLCPNLFPHVEGAEPMKGPTGGANPTTTNNSSADEETTTRINKAEHINAGQS
jgi:hypothetical protein